MKQLDKWQWSTLILSAILVMAFSVFIYRYEPFKSVFLADMSLFAEMNAVYAKYFEGDFPARSAVAVKALPKGALVEIESIAVR